MRIARSLPIGASNWYGLNQIKAFDLAMVTNGTSHLWEALMESERDCDPVASAFSTKPRGLADKI